MPKHVIFLAFDEPYAIYARACLNSLRANFPEYPHLAVYYRGANQEMLEFLQKIPRLELLREISPEPLALRLNTGPVASPSVFYKYHAFSPAFDDYDSVLYLDADTLVMKPLTELIAGRQFCAVMNHEPSEEVRIFKPDCLNDPRLKELMDEDGLAGVLGMDDMCNAGVILVSREYRTVEHYAQLLTITQRYDPFLAYADQSAISIWCKLNGIEFSRQYEFNYQSTFFGFDDTRREIQDVSILHFSNKKPNTVDFMLGRRISADKRKQLARMFVDYTETMHST